MENKILLQNLQDEINYLRKNIQLYINLLKSNELKEEFKIFLLQDLISNSNDRLVYEIYMFLLKNPHCIDYNYLAENTKLGIDIIQKIFTEKPIEVKFPIASNTSADIIKALIFKFNQEISINTFNNKHNFSEIKAFLKNYKNIDFKDFFVIFTGNFEGNSYQLALLVGLIVKKSIIQKYTFTGLINSVGDILHVDHLSQKEKIAKENNLILIQPKYFNHFNYLIDFLSKKIIKIPFVILNKSDEIINNSIDDIIDLLEDDKILKYLEMYGISKEDLYVQVLDLPPDKEIWDKKLDELSKKIFKIFTIPYKQVELHLVGGIATFSFLAGCIIGSKQSYVIYHYLPHEKKYYPVIDLTNNKIRDNKKIKNDILENSNCISVETHLSSGSNLFYHEATLIIYLASHSPIADVIEYTKSDEYILIYDKKDQGKISIDTSWTEYSSEIYSAINKLKEKYRIKRFKLFMSMPCAIALAVGMAIGNLIDIDVYNYFSNIDGKYFLVGNPTNYKALI